MSRPNWTKTGSPVSHRPMAAVAVAVAYIVGQAAVDTWGN